MFLTNHTENTFSAALRVSPHFLPAYGISMLWQLHRLVTPLLLLIVVTINVNNVDGAVKELKPFPHLLENQRPLLNPGKNHHKHIHWFETPEVPGNVDVSPEAISLQKSCGCLC